MLKVKPIISTNLFPVERKALLDILKSIKNEQWFSETVCKGWSVKDIAQHLLKDDIGILSRKRDGFNDPKSLSKKINNNVKLINYINTKNHEWIEISRSFSPRTLIEFLGFTGKLTYDYWKTLDQTKVEANVCWISEELVPNWIDIAREYTERWLHQTHIREALNLPLLESEELFHPFIQTYMLALPLTYKSVTTDDNDTIKIIVEGKAGGVWYLTRSNNEWGLYDNEHDGDVVTEIIIEQDTLWRLFSKGISKEKARELVKISGNKALGEHIFNTVSLIA